MFKKMLLTLAMVAMLVVPAMATDLYETPGSPDMYYYEDEAVKGGYVQGMLPLQGVALNGAIAYGEFGMSADFAALQALPMAQAMAGVGNAGVMTHNTYKSGSTQVNLDVIKVTATDDYYDDYYYGYGFSGTIYNPNYNGYYYNNYLFSGTSYGDFDFCWVGLDFYKSFNENSYLTLPLPATLEMNAFQAASNSITFENGPMKLKMDQSAVQAGKLKVTGYGTARNGQICN